MLNKYWLFLLLFCTSFIQAQKTQDYTANYIKMAAFMNNEMAVTPFFPLNESFSIEFDDLYGDEGNYFYRVLAYNYDWTPSQLKPIDYIQGMDNQRIQQYTTSFNTLQMYTHYRLTIPNSVYRITKSGNYILEIYDEDNQVVIRRKFVLYENVASVGAQVKRARDLTYIDQKQTLELTVKLGEQPYQNPTSNVKIALFQNGRWDSYITKVPPQYTLGTDLIYKYDQETSFWGGNQFRYFDNSDLKQANNMIYSNSKENDMYKTILYPITGWLEKKYSYFPDINGSFKVRNLFGKNASIEGEYSWVYFSFEPIDDDKNNTYYVTGMFNNYELTSEHQLDYNPQTERYEKAVLIKQGFTNYNVTTAQKGKVSPAHNPDGNHALTTNKYQVLVYYKGTTDLYDRVIGFAEANAEQITY
ncbi:DUF5103 domain-containing protein [Myroides sp. WP-1]|uniref:type IX secretion system plug protein n=1 Tax=Myroides sp. WP-1 TaxID=2759944 RepID=UPI0015FBF991|nr:DUF5103 domain-containing protein [Myroides sp. WP-1]MBB1139623.1 DUF5103 domain-containing protein [Myroides sp. WP-1]